MGTIGIERLGQQDGGGVEMGRVRVFLFSLIAVFFLTSAIVYAQGEDVQKHPSCKYCGMDRQKFAHSRMMVEYDDDSATSTCSIHCLAVDLALGIDKTPKSMQVGDYGTKSLIDAEKAYWVIGGSKPGVMTKRAKWAFEKKEDAEAFVKENEGIIATFDDAMKAAYEDMYADTKMIRDKRAKMKAMKAAEEKK
jgi:nitrous oxide reductase accessory protein NosL